MQVLDAGRIGIAALSVGLAQGAYEAALQLRAASARRSARPISAFQAIQWKLADTATRIEAARLLTYRAAYLKDRGAAGRRSSRRWPSCTRARSPCGRPTTACRFTAATGSSRTIPAEKFFRDVKLTTIGEGTSEIQRLVIARQLLAR